MGVPTMTELAALADRAAGLLVGPGQVAVRWELGSPARATFTAVQDGRGARAETKELDDAGLRRAARAAALHARQARAWPVPALPEPAPGRAHDGFDPAVAAGLKAPAAPEGLELDWRPGAARLAVASTTGVRASEARSHVVARLRGVRADGRSAAVTLAAVGPPELAAAAGDVRALLGEGDPSSAFALAVPARLVTAPTGDVPVVLGPEAVATVLAGLRRAFGVDLALGGGPLAARRGRTVAAGAVNLSDSAQHPATLPRSYDDEGVPRRPVALIEDGVAGRQVHDCSSAARAGETTTGHATRALALAPLPDNLVLAGGDAATVAELCAGMGRGVFIPALERTAGGHATLGAAAVQAGRATGALARTAVEVDPIAVLAGVQALTAAQRLVALPPGCPGGSASAVVPALRAGTGLRLRR